jgi:hypothetical protein
MKGLVMTYARLVAVALAALAASSARADIIVNGSFEDPVLSVGEARLFGTGSTIGTGWTVLGTPGNTNAVYVLQTAYSEPGNAVTAFNAQEGLNSVDLNGAFNQGFASGVRQTIPTSAGATYRVSFYVGRADGNHLYATPSTVDLSIDSGARLSFTNSNSTPNALNWQQFTWDFVATGSSTVLDFFNGQVTNNFSGLDNVSVNGVPESGAIVLVAGGLLLAALAVQRAPRPSAS